MKRIIETLFQRSLIASKKRQAAAPSLVEIKADSRVVQAVVGGASSCSGIEGTG